jgi:hypothetical protein
VLQQQLTGKELPTQEWFGGGLGQPSNTSALRFALYLPTESRAARLADKAGPIVAPTLEAARQVTHLVLTRQRSADLEKGVVTVDTFLVSLADARVLCSFRVAPQVDPKDQGSLMKTVRVYGDGRREDVGTNTYGGFGIGMTNSLRNGISDGSKKHFGITASGEPLPVDLFH